MMPAVCLERSKKQFSFCLAFLSGGASSPSEPFQPFERLARSARPTKGPMPRGPEDAQKRVPPRGERTGRVALPRDLVGEHVWEATEKRKPL